MHLLVALVLLPSFRLVEERRAHAIVDLLASKPEEENFRTSVPSPQDPRAPADPNRRPQYKFSRVIWAIVPLGSATML